MIVILHWDSTPSHAENGQWGGGGSLLGLKEDFDQNLVPVHYGREVDPENALSHRKNEKTTTN